MGTDANDGMQILDERACWDLLATTDVGRLAISITNHPDIFPINFAVDDHHVPLSVVFRTAEGTKLAAALLGVGVAFEADGVIDGEAWSVVVKGTAVEIEEVNDWLDAIELPLYPWLASAKHRFVRIVPDRVTGRRFAIHRDTSLDPDYTIAGS